MNMLKDAMCLNCHVGIGGDLGGGGIWNSSGGIIPLEFVFQFEWRLYALSASKVIFRVRTYSRITYSVEID